ncbi:MAG: hypothetical protein ACSW75_06705, partial [Lachnospiraceae bacterium]
AHTGMLDHAQLIGQPEGVIVRNSSGTAYQALRPLPYKVGIHIARKFMFRKAKNKTGKRKGASA